MAISHGSVHDVTARGQAARIQHNDVGLLIQYNDHEEIVEDQYVVAVISRRELDRRYGEDDKTVIIMLLRAKGSSINECFFETIGR